MHFLVTLLKVKPLKHLLSSQNPGPLTSQSSQLYPQALHLPTILTVVNPVMQVSAKAGLVLEQASAFGSVHFLHCPPAKVKSS